MTSVFAYGRLGSAPTERTTRKGSMMATASLAASVGGGTDAPETAWFGLVAFGSTAETLLKHGKGDLISVGGELQMNRWTDSTGVEHERLQVVVAQVASPRTVRPGVKRKAPAETAPPPATNRAPGADAPPSMSPATRQASRFDTLEITNDDIPF
jgi:single-strand DNA-binding protein